jgi:threonine aldolase
MAALTGHEEGMFVASGTMGNQLCLRTHLTQPPHSVLCDERAHIYTNEAGGLAMFSQAMTTTIRPKNGKYITLEEVKAAIVTEDVHYAPTRVVSLENTLHGIVLPYVEAKRISEYIRTEYKGEIKLHLDGISIHPRSMTDSRRSIMEWCNCRKYHIKAVLFVVRFYFFVFLERSINACRIRDRWIYAVH